MKVYDTVLFHRGVYVFFHYIHACKDGFVGV